MKRLILAMLFAFSAASPSLAASEKANDTYKYLDLLGAVFERVRANYVEKVTDKKLIEAAVSGMLRSLDPHSSYMSPESFKEMRVQTRGNFGGLGIEVTTERGFVKVVTPIDDTPAARAGLRTGDLISHIDGKPIVGFSLRDAVKKMRGPVGSKIVIRVRRAKTKPFDVTIIRAVITIKSVRSRIIGNVGYVRLSAFTEQTSVGLKRALEGFKTKLGPKWRGLVLDMRNNPGGLLSQAIDVVDMLLEKGEIVSTRGREAKISSRFNAKPGDLTNGLPIVVLINGGSASASEIVAGALQDHRRAIVMGTKSFGKGSVQTIIPLGNQGAMRLTTARYYTPSGRSIQAKGIVPDLLVEQAKLTKIDTPTRTREADLRGALDANKKPAKKEAKKLAKKPAGATGKDANKKDPKSKAGKDGKAAAPAKNPVSKSASKPEDNDYQLTRAISLLNGIALYETTRKK